MSVKTFWEVFVDLYAKSVVTQSIITIAVIITVCILWGTGRPVPVELYALASLIVGFFFGSKTQIEAIRSSNSRS